MSALSIGLHTAWRRAQGREQWQRTAEAAMLALHDDDDDDAYRVKASSRSRLFQLR